MLNSIKLVYTEKPASDGLSSDLLGNLWVTCVEHSAIATLHASSKLSMKDSKPLMNFAKVVQDKELLRWPDGLSFGPDGLYITNSALHYKFSSLLSFDINDFVKKHGPFHILRIPQEALRLVSGENLPYPGH